MSGQHPHEQATQGALLRRSMDGPAIVLLVGLGEVIVGWRASTATARWWALGAGVALTAATLAYYYRAMWPLDLTQQQRLDRTAARAWSARPLPLAAVGASLLAVVLAYFTEGVGMILLPTGMVLVAHSCWIAVYLLMLRRLRGRVIWRELATAAELSARIARERSGGAFQGPFLPRS